MKQIYIHNIGTTYYITEDGKCYNSKTNKWLKGQVGKNGYLSYNLTLPNGDKKRIYAHRLVASCYLTAANVKQTEVNHKDGNKLNNHVDNLEWVTPSENQRHAVEHGLRPLTSVYCFNKNKELVAEYKSIAEAAKAAGISISLISQEINKEIKALSGGFYWSNNSTLGEVIEYKNYGKAKQVYQYDLNGKFITSYESTGIAAKAINGTHSHISECCRGKIKSYKGSIWRYANDIVSPSGESQRE